MQTKDITRIVGDIQDPNTQQLLDADAQIKNLQLVGQDVTFDLELGYPARSQVAAMRERISGALRNALPKVGEIMINVVSNIQSHATQRGVSLPGVKNIIAVGSGKGGVGKSTTAVNLALALSAEGAQVGVLDADIYGPSQPIMLGIEDRPKTVDGKSMEPLINYGVQVSSIGFLVDPDQAMVWRGPMATKALEQLLRQTNWKDLDYLVVDMPPGTGDIQLSLSQRVPITGAVIVTTPQDIALADARKAVTMFEKVGVPILGLVENMAVYTCPNCGHTEHIFGADGGRRYAEKKDINYLGALPLALSIREQTDSGNPSVVAEPDGEIAAIYKSVARQVGIEIAKQIQQAPKQATTFTMSRDT